MASQPTSAQEELQPLLNKPTDEENQNAQGSSGPTNGEAEYTLGKSTIAWYTGLLLVGLVALGLIIRGFILAGDKDVRSSQQLTRNSAKILTPICLV
jgi:hypothetical protein